MDTSGTVSFQAHDRKDVFHVAEVRENGIETPDEELLGIESSQFDNEQEWVTGRISKMNPVQVDGDTTVIHAWFKGDNFVRSFRITVYVEYEEVEELQATEPDEKSDEEKSSCDMEPNEIHL